MLSNWQRAQMIKQNAVRVKWAHLNPAAQDLIGKGGLKELLNVPYENAPIPKLRVLRKYRVMSEATIPFFTALTAKGPIPGDKIVTILSSGVTLSSAGFRTAMARLIQERHEEIAGIMKNHGIMQTHFEKGYPQDWLNPTIVAETHPIFSVQRNGDIIFRRVTAKEFKLLKMQENWIGKAGLNIWRWRGILRKPLAPEVERKKLGERLKALALRFKPIRNPKPALGSVGVQRRRFARHR